MKLATEEERESRSGPEHATSGDSAAGVRDIVAEPGCATAEPQLLRGLFLASDLWVW